MAWLAEVSPQKGGARNEGVRTLVYPQPLGGKLRRFHTAPTSVSVFEFRAMDMAETPETPTESVAAGAKQPRLNVGCTELPWH